MPTYDERTALVVVDVQNDFADPAGSLYVSGGEEVPSLADVEVTKAAAAGAVVFYTQDWHPASTQHFQKDGGIWPVHCVRGTWGAELHPALRVRGEVIRKGADGSDAYSGFSARDPESGETASTGLDGLLHEREVERIVVCGLATDYCVVETVLDARMLGYPVEVLRRAIRAVDVHPGDGERATTRMRDAGAEMI